MWWSSWRAAIALIALAIAGCGFALRGATEIPFATIYSGFPDSNPIGAEFRRQLRASAGTRVVEQPQDAEAQFQVLTEAREQEILAFTTTGRPREYQLRLRLVFRVHDGRDREFIGPSEIVLRRDLTTTDTRLTGRAQEDAQLYREMEIELVQQLIRRLAAVKR